MLAMVKIIEATKLHTRGSTKPPTENTDPPIPAKHISGLKELSKWSNDPYKYAAKARYFSLETMKDQDTIPVINPARLIPMDDPTPDQVHVQAKQRDIMLKTVNWRSTSAV
ncbi:hypothetical protein N7532_008665 [Penicillium argentinense]|uniref:Uncharacterized protein n=1 Tax=Penicillium argentinense TaxID=1131581 RepID=A0A9W9EY23_9EURO|nr:uncharacterized protein N7532_008665 [Penicillium argentinense]KAJ5089981.1 hypothetical protein N7532_008665 [Penicillium argentinense]